MVTRRIWSIPLLIAVCVLLMSCATPATTQPPVATQLPTGLPSAEPRGPGLTEEDDLFTNPPPPQNLRAEAMEEGVRLTWDPPPPVSVPHAYSDDLAHYRVFRRSANEASTTLLDTTEATTYVDTSPLSGQVFYLVTVVHAGDTEGSRMESGRPNEVAVTVGD